MFLCIWFHLPHEETFLLHKVMILRDIRISLEIILTCFVLKTGRIRTYPRSLCCLFPGSWSPNLNSVGYGSNLMEWTLSNQTLVCYSHVFYVTIVLSYGWQHSISKSVFRLLYILLLFVECWVPSHTKASEHRDRVSCRL